MTPPPRGLPPVSFRRLQTALLRTSSGGLSTSQFPDELPPQIARLLYRLRGELRPPLVHPLLRPLLSGFAGPLRPD